MRGWWWLVVVLGCEGRSPAPPVTPEPVTPQAATPDATTPDAAPRFDVVLAEIAIDHPTYPDPPPGTPIRADAGAIQRTVERTIQREVGRIAACVNEPKSAAIVVWFELDERGAARHVGAGASLTSPGQDPARDRCIAGVIEGVAFPPPGRVAPVELVLVVRTPD